MNKVFALYQADLGLLPDIQYSPPSLPGMNSECRATVAPNNRNDNDKRNTNVFHKEFLRLISAQMIKMRTIDFINLKALKTNNHIKKEIMNAEYENLIHAQIIKLCRYEKSIIKE